MTKAELRTLNAELIEMLIAMRDEIDEKLDESAAVENGDEDEDAELDEDEED